MRHGTVATLLLLLNLRFHEIVDYRKNHSHKQRTISLSTIPFPTVPLERGNGDVTAVDEVDCFTDTVGFIAVDDIDGFTEAVEDEGLTSKDVYLQDLH